jgi:predicted metalloprotease with PDZ domain
LSEASFDAWVKYWRNRQNSRNAESDYYGKGQHVSLLLDLHIRHLSGNRSSLDDVMKEMVRRFPRSKGFTNEEFIAVCEEFAGKKLTTFFNGYLYGTAPLDWEGALAFAGLEVLPKGAATKNGLGIVTQETGEKLRVAGVPAGSPAETAGFEIHDEILALNGYRLRGADLQDRLSSMKSGEKIVVTIFRNDKIREIHTTVQPLPSGGYTVVRSASPTKLQERIFTDWLRTSR